MIKKNFNLSSLKSHPDFFLLEGKNSIKIEQVRELKKNLSLKPYSAPVKLAFIPEAEKLTLPAQNALLKTLEEPSPKSLIILSSSNPKLLLPTIVSRCQIIRLPSEPQMEINKSVINHLLNSGVGERLKIAAQYSQNKEEAIKFTQIQLLIWREKLLKNHSPQVVENIRRLQATLQMLQANVNPGLALGNLLLNFVPP